MLIQRHAPKTNRSKTIAHHDIDMHCRMGRTITVNGYAEDGYRFSVTLTDDEVARLARSLGLIETS